MVALTASQVWEALDDVKDPEIPVVSMVEMGLIRQVGVEGNTVFVTMTPTFVGCPALKVMEFQIKARLQALGAEEVNVKVTHHPPWSTEWITPAAREKLKAFGLAPPPHHSGNVLAALEEPAVCPYCGSQETILKNSFGPTLCRAIYYCKSCNQPFEQFKPV